MTQPIHHPEYVRGVKDAIQTATESSICWRTMAVYTKERFTRRDMDRMAKSITQLIVSDILILIGPDP